MNCHTLHILNDQLQQALQAQKLERVTSLLRDMQDEIINIQAREAKEDIKRRIREELAKKAKQDWAENIHSLRNNR